MRTLCTTVNNEGCEAIWILAHRDTVNCHRVGPPAKALIEIHYAFAPLPLAIAHTGQA